MIIATAGHVDHGKTSLVRQLTGVDTDRLEEEKRRGLSISLGYAYLPQAAGTPLGFIDVPGHQRFINNMIAGISGIDIGLLVIAADDGPMPQTHEHMDVLQLLGVKRLIVAISKIDRVEHEQIERVTSQVEGLFPARPWSRVPIFPVSNTDGTGVDQLKSYLLEQADETSERSRAGHFRLSIDRVFVAKGAGVIVTGTASAGTVNVGETLKLLPQNVELRVRGLRVHDEEADQARAGQRCALNIVGKVEAAAIDRGDWLTGTGAAPAGRRVDTSFTLSDNAPFAVKHLSPIKLYIGSKRIAGRLAMLHTERDDNRLQPGDHCLAQLILDQDMACCHGERFLLRDHAENVILGGGSILDPAAPAAGKSRPTRLAWLEAMRTDTPEKALADVIAQGQLTNLDQFRQAWNIRDDELVETSDDTRLFSAEAGNWAVSEQRWLEADRLLVTRLDDWHQEHAEQPGIKATDLKNALLSRCESPLLMAVLTARLRDGTLVLREGLISRKGFKPSVSRKAAVHWQQLEQHLQSCGKRIPLLSEVSSHTQIEARDLDQIAKQATKRGELCNITEKRYALPTQLYQFACDLLAFAASDEPISVVAMKNCFGTGRNLTIDILEYFDRVRFTQRRGDTRVILDPELPVKLFKR